MKWQGTTAEQRVNDMRQWHVKFALTPTQMSNGVWLWLTWYWRRAVSIRKNCAYRYACFEMLGEALDYDKAHERPAPPTPTVKQ